MAVKGLFQEDKQIVKPGNNGLYALVQSMKELKQAIGNINIPDTTEVSNIDYVKKYLRDELAILANRLMKVFRLIQIPNTVKVSNFPKYPDVIKVTDTEKILEALHDLRSITAQLDVSPNITVEAPKIPEIILPKAERPIVKVDPPVVNVEPVINLSELLDALRPLKYLSGKAGKPLSVQLSDGVRFVKALKDVVNKQERQITAFASSKGMDEDEFKKQFRASTRGTTIVSGSKTITLAVTAEKLIAASTPCMCVDVGADTANAGMSTVGGADVVATPGSQKGCVLFGGNPMTRMWIDNVNKLYGAVETNGDKIIFNYLTY